MSFLMLSPMKLPVKISLRKPAKTDAGLSVYSDLQRIAHLRRKRYDKIKGNCSVKLNSYASGVALTHIPSTPEAGFSTLSYAPRGKREALTK